MSLAWNRTSPICARNSKLYLADGKTYAERLIVSIPPIAGDFSQAAILTAIRAAQSDEIRYPVFVERVAAAGIAAYWAFLTGKKVIYFGRKGEFHLEEFSAPQALASRKPPALS